MSRNHMILAFLLALLVLSPAVGMSAPAAGASPVQKVSRWESNLSAGWLINEKIGIIKSFWWYPLPKIIAIGLSFDYVGPTLPMSLNIAVNLPIPVVVPFVSAGAGTSLTRGGITNYGGGIKFRFWRKIGLIFEYRNFSYRRDPNNTLPGKEKANSDYIGAGIAYLF